MTGTVDPVTLAVIQSGLIQVCNEMDLAFVRAAFSPVISAGRPRPAGLRRHHAVRHRRGHQARA